MRFLFVLVSVFPGTLLGTAFLGTASRARALDENESCLFSDASLMNLVASDADLGFELAPTGGGVRVRALRASRIVGERELSLAGTDCQTRIETLRFVVQAMRSALTLATSEQEPLSRPAPTPEEPSTSPTGTAELAAMTGQRAEGLAPPPSRGRARVPRRVPRRPTPPLPEAAQPIRDTPTRTLGFVFVGADLTTGRVPNVPLGPVVGVGLDRGRWSASLSLLYQQGRLSPALDSAILVRTVSFALESCVMSRESSFRVGGCGLFAAGFVQGQGEGFREQTRSVLASVSAGAHLALRYERSRYRVSLHAGPRVMIQRASFDTQRPSLTYEQSLGALSVGVFWGARWGDEA